MGSMANPRRDPRTAPYRSDLAAAKLRGLVDAPRYAEPIPMEIAAGIAPVKAGPDNLTEMVSQGLYGEAVSVYDREGDWSWVQIETDDYVGYVPSAALGPPGPAKTHRIGAQASFLYPRADLKAPQSGIVSLGSPVCVTAEQNGFSKLAGGQFIWSGHLVRLDHFESHFTDVALRFLGAPYLWGGRSSIGLDCSALLQLALGATGIAAPRDSDMQMALGTDVPVEAINAGSLRRGDLIFWRGHIGILTSPTMMLHANAHHMAVAEERLSKAIDRIGASGLPVLSIRRF